MRSVRGASAGLPNDTPGGASPNFSKGRTPEQRAALANSLIAGFWPMRADQAFGWPHLLDGSPLPGDKQLLALSSGDPWGEWSEGGKVNFMISNAALRAGDFTQVEACPNGW
ncbi:hypothetical protein [Actinoallomurus sp. NPDC050550]|uniref:hypothetical protein n=1 Tax=Actinoallomurus sp. NPDC050550 TaxID=3154937 RepID=UPI0034018FC0